MTKIQKQLLMLTRAECKNNKVKLYLGKGKAIQYTSTVKVNGYFDPEFEENVPKLACAMGVKNWELVLAHELNHMRQWIENCKTWRNYVKITGNIITEAISGKKVNNQTFKKNIFITIEMERDCERRTYETLKELKYPKKKLEEYVQKANAYTIFYIDILHHKKWYIIGQEPYNLKNVWSKFPKTFDVNIEEIYQKLGHLYANCLNIIC